MTPLTKTTLLKEDNMLKRNLFLVAIPIIGLIIVVFVIMLSPVNELATASENEANLQRSFEADTARYSAMATFYLDKDKTERQRPVEAIASRYQGLADHYTNIQRAFEADAARYNAMAAFYLAKDEARTQWAVEAEAARYQELAEFYLLQTLSQN